MAPMSVGLVHHIFLGDTGLSHRGAEQCQASP